MKTRAQLINSTLKISSIKDEGTALHLNYIFK
jgi:two-component system NarL family sensor kinase